jgi:hypothetical protein
MGYRSDVGIALGFKTKEACDKFILTYKLKKPEFWQEMVAGIWERPLDEVLTARYDDVKWNRGYDDVDAVYDMFEWANSNHDASYRVVRIGEDNDDVEIEEYYHDDVDLYLDEFVDIHRRIDIEEGQTLE